MNDEKTMIPMSAVREMLNDAKWSHEQESVRQDRTIIRLIRVIILLIVLLVGTNAGWLYYESQWVVTETSSQEVHQDIDSGDGDIGTVIGIGDINGESEADSQTNDN